MLPDRNVPESAGLLLASDNKTSYYLQGIHIRPGPGLKYSQSFYWVEPYHITIFVGQTSQILAIMWLYQISLNLYNVSMS